MTHRDELERLAARHGATLNRDPRTGYIDSVTLRTGRTMEPLVFAEWARGRV